MEPRPAFNRDVTRWETNEIAVTPKFSDSLNLFQSQWQIVPTKSALSHLRKFFGYHPDYNSVIVTTRSNM